MDLMECWMTAPSEWLCIEVFKKVEGQGHVHAPGVCSKADDALEKTCPSMDCMILARLTRSLASHRVQLLRRDVGLSVGGKRFASHDELRR